MGRHKIATPEMVFFQRTDQKPNKKGQQPIYFRYVYDEDKIDRATGLRVRPNEWDANRQKVKAAHPDSDEYNGRMQLLKSKYDKPIIEYANVKGSITIAVIKDILSGKDMLSDKAEDEDFFKLAYAQQKSFYDREKIVYSTYKNNLNRLSIFNEFITKQYARESIFCLDIDKDMIDRYIVWRKEDKGNENESINKALTPLIKAIKLASAKGLIKTEVLAMLAEGLYLKVKEDVGDEDKEGTDVKYLTSEQLQKLIALYPALKYDRTRDYLDMFLFSVHTGLRVSDVMILKWSNIDFDKKYLKMVLFKKSQTVAIPLLEPAIKILNKWQERKLNKVFVFDLLGPDFDMTDKKELDKMRINKNTAIGTSLEEVGKKLELPFNMRMHCARHTFAVLAINNGVDLHTLSKVMGHRDSSVTERVYAKLLPEKIESEIRKKLTFDFTPSV